jgi:hypothetical protein
MVQDLVNEIFVCICSLFAFTLTPLISRQRSKEVGGMVLVSITSLAIVFNFGYIIFGNIKEILDKRRNKRVVDKAEQEHRTDEDHNLLQN